MAMPAGGCIGLRCCITGIACSSIGIAVCGTLQTPTSLLEMANSGVPRYAAMTNFYNYIPPKEINLYRYGSLGTDGSTSYISKAHCLVASPAMVVGNTYSVNIKGDLCTITQAPSSYAWICVTCNNVHKICCCIGPNQCNVNPSTTFNVDYNDVVRIYTCGCATNTACPNSVSSRVCLNTVSVVSGDIVKGTTCDCNCTWTG